MELRASSIASLPPSKRQAFLDSLSQDELTHLEHDWRFWARDGQLAPDGLWRIWLVLAGRGFGKTRVGAEWCHEQAMSSVSRGAIVAANMEDARKVCIEGESGILATGKPWFMPKFEPSKNGGTVTWPNGSQAELYSGDNPQSLRGPQFAWCWTDELLKWRRMQATWDMLRFCLRLGQDPRTVITSTPTPAKLLRELVADQRLARDGTKLVRITRGSTFDNAANLAQDFLDELKAKYEGTRLGRQELHAEILTDKPGALWTLSRLDEHRCEHTVTPDGQIVHAHPDLRRVVVAIDPPITSGEDADECGIVAAGLGANAHGYVLADASEKGLSPKQWAEKALGLYVDHKADCIVAEANQGGEMITQVIRDIDNRVPVRLVFASRGKVTRAEPVSNLYEQGRVHHVGTFKVLEDQMCLAAGTMIETVRGHVAVEQVVPGDLVLTRNGYRAVEIACETGCSFDFVVIEAADGRTLRCTPTHPILDATSGQFVPAKSVRAGMLLDASPNWASMGRRSLGVASGITACRAVITGMRRGLSCIARSGRRIAAQFLTAATSIISTGIRATTSSTICWSSLRLSMTRSIRRVAFGHSVLNGEASLLYATGSIANGMSSNAFNAESPAGRRTRAAASSVMTCVAADTDRRNSSLTRTAPGASVVSRRATQGASIAVTRVTTLRTTTAESVFNLKVEGQHEYYANGILTHNCDFTTDFDRKTAGYSPDRLDALVWAITELMLQPRGEPRITRI